MRKEGEGGEVFNSEEEGRRREIYLLVTRKEGEGWRFTSDEGGRGRRRIIYQ